MKEPNAPFTTGAPPYRYQYQYVEPPQQVIQTGQLRAMTSWLALAIFIHLLLSAFLPTLLTMLFSGVLMSISGGYSALISTDGFGYFVNLTSYVISYLLPFWLYLQFLHMPAKAALPLHPPRRALTVSGVFIGLGASSIGALCVQMVSVVCSFLGVVPISPDFSLPTGVAANILYCIMLVIAAPIVEEFVFRGAIMQSFRRYGDIFALVISSVLFALLHGNLVQAPNAFLMGLVMGFFALRTDSLWGSISIHMVNNFAAVLLIYAGSAMDPRQEMFLNEWVVLGYALLGLTALVTMMLRHGSLFALRDRAGCVLTTRQKYRAFFTSLPMLVMIAVFLFAFIRNMQVI